MSAERPASAEVTSYGALPDVIDERLAGRDTRPLPAGALLRFQTISHHPDPRTNHRWELYDDGAVHLAFHSRDDEGPAPFDTELPDAPTGRLEESSVAEIRTLLEEEGFAELAPHQQLDGEDGSWRVVTARVGGVEHEVVFDRVTTPLVERLRRVPAELEG